MRNILLILTLLATLGPVQAEDFTIPVAIEVISTPKDKNQPATKVSTSEVLFGYAVLPIKTSSSNWRITIDIETDPAGRPSTYSQITVEDLAAVAPRTANAEGGPVEIFSANFAFTPNKAMTILDTPEVTLSVTIVPSAKVE